MKTEYIVTRDNLKKGHGNEAIDHVELNMLHMPVEDIQRAEVVLFIDSGQWTPGRIRMCKVLKDRGGNL
jgi:hypothetical protein